MLLWSCPWWHTWSLTSLVPVVGIIRTVSLFISITIARGRNVLALVPYLRLLGSWNVFRIRSLCLITLLHYSCIVTGRRLISWNAFRIYFTRPRVRILRLMYLILLIRGILLIGLRSHFKFLLAHILLPGYDIS